MLSRFHLVPERNGQTDRQTDGQTDRFAISISRVSMLTRDKNSYMVYRTAPFSLTLNNPKPRFQGQAIFLTLSPKRLKIRS